MKNKLKILTIILLMFTLIIKVSAVTISTNSTAGTIDTNSRLVTNTGTLSVTNVDSGDTFKAYKVIDTFYNSTTNNITYEFTSTFKTFLQNASGTIEVSGSTKNISALTVADYQALTSGDTTNGSTTTASTLDVLLSKYAAYVKANSVTGTNMTVSGTTASASVAAGSWLVLPTSTQKVYAVMANNVAFTGNGSTWTLNNATIVAKKSSPSITKEVRDYIGGGWASSISWFNSSYSPNGDSLDDLRYKLTINAPQYPTNATNTTLIIEDTFGAGITFGGLDTIEFNDNNFSINTSTGVISYNFTDMNLSKNPKEFGNVKTLEINDGYNGIINITNQNVGTVTFSNNKLTFTFTSNILSFLVITYTASLNNNAVLGPTGNVNTAKMTYSNDPYGSGTTYVQDTATVYTYGVKVLKKNSSNTPLPGAQIRLCQDNACSQQVYIWDSTENDYVPCVATTDANGYATFTGVMEPPSGYPYYYQEVKAPIGYRLDSTIYSVTIDNTTAYTTANLVNQPLGVLPATGGIGTYIYTGVGALMIIGALVILVHNKKKQTIN